MSRDLRSAAAASPMVPSSRSLRRVLAVVVALALPLLVLIALEPDHNGDDNQGYWGAKTANTNWCESDYVVTPYVAEFFNALSSLLIVAQALHKLVVHAHFEARFALCFAMMAIVGIGSFGFHATLWRSMQAADELPMIFVNSAFLYVLTGMESPRRRVGEAYLAEFRTRWRASLLLLLLTAAETYAIVRYDTSDQLIFLLCYGGGVLYIWRASEQLSARLDPEGRANLLQLSLVVYISGFDVWLVDRRFCAHVRSLQLHSLWHVCASLGTATAVLNWMWCRHTWLGDRPQVAGPLPLQRIVIGADDRRA